MREILFRGKCKTDNEWWYGFPYVTRKNAVKINWYCSEFGSMRTDEVEPETVGQYTGLTDKNGKKVFDGDIIRKTNKGRHPEIFIANIRTCFYTNEEVYYSPFDHFTESCEYEIIGNITDNPELLEK